MTRKINGEFSRRSGGKSISSDSIKSSHTMQSNYRSTFVDEVDVTEGDRENKQASDEAIRALIYALSIQRKQLGANHAAIVPTLCALGKAYFKRRKYDEAVGTYEECLRIRKDQSQQKGTLPGKGVADILNRLGNVRCKQSLELLPFPFAPNLTKTESSPKILLKQAMTRYQSALLIHKQLSNECSDSNVNENFSRIVKTEDEAHILESIGNVHSYLKEYKEALECFTISLRFWSVQPKGANNTPIANTLIHIGDLHKSRGGNMKSLHDYNLSIEAYTNALKLYPKEENIYLSRIYDSIAGVSFKMKKYEECLQMCNESLRIKLKLLGNQHIYTTKTYYLRGSASSELGDVNRGLIDLRYGLKIQLTRLRKREIDFAALTKGKDIFEDEDQQFAVISGEYNQVMMDLTKSYFDISTYYRSIATMCKTLGDLNSALIASKSDLEYSKLYLSEDNHELGAIIEKIGVIQFDLGKLDEAMISFKEVVRLRKLKFGRHHLAVVSSKNNIGNILNAKQELQEALSTYMDALVDLKMIKDNYPQTIAVMDNIATIYAKLHEFEKARNMYQESLKLKRLRLKNIESESETKMTHYSIAVSLKYIGIIFYHEEKWSDALEYFKDAINEKAKATPTEDIEIAEISFNIGNIYSLLNNFKQASLAYNKSLHIKRFYLGECEEVTDIEKKLKLLDKK